MHLPFSSTMWYTFVVILMTSGTSGTSAGHVAHNDSSIVVTYSGHAEAVPPSAAKKTCSTGSCKSGATSSSPGAVKDVDNSRQGGGGYAERHNKNSETNAPDVVFIPSENHDGGEYASKRDNLPPRTDEVKLKDVLNRQTINDMINHPVRVETETPPAILFISGKNNENVDRPKKEEPSRRSGQPAPQQKEASTALDCRHLDCNNTQASVCGVKLEQRKPKYRLFLNECYFRKVNCAFSFEYSRYGIAPHHKCDTVGSHSNGKMDLYDPRYEPRYIPLHSPRRSSDEEVLVDRRSFASRRALTTGTDGEMCAHACPAHCRDDYAPECAAAGLALRVFMNHCQLDRHSCATEEAWQKRPLADCVGPKKAEVQNNRAFIGWMQRVGIVDTKGRMVLA